jgi:hypothetical protein
VRRSRRSVTGVGADDCTKAHSLLASRVTVIAKLSLSLTYVWATIVGAFVFVVGIGVSVIFILLLLGVGLFNLAERLFGFQICMTPIGYQRPVTDPLPTSGEPPHR